MTNTPKSRSIAATSKGLEKVRNKMAELKKPENLGNRGKQSWTQEYLAKQSSVSLDTVKRFLKGTPVDKDCVLNICKALNLNFNEIVGELSEEHPPEPGIWPQICRDILSEQQKKQQLPRQVTEFGFELNMYVPLGLLERKQQQRRDESVPKDDVYQLDPQVIVKEYENKQFLTEVIQGGNDQRFAIIGEPGAGKTTLLDKIASWIDDNDLGLPICIPLGGLQGETLAGYLLKIWLKQATKSEATQEDLATSLEQQFRAGKVWLLLDAVDEMAAASPAEALAKIRDELVGWVAEARVVLTCRLNVWDASVNNVLPGFETYRTLEFKPEQVDEFIGEWFAKAQEKNPLGNCLSKGEKLLAKLKEPNRDNIYNLVRSPLRLALLCQTFYLSPDEELPETQAMLYERFIRYFYEWKQEQHSTTRAQRQQLNEVLGELAKAGIESESRFRLMESWAIQLMGESQFKLAEKLGWLNLVDRDAKTDEAVYAFFHPTFQEYFAAKAIENWHFFLHHVPDNPKLGIYRIFERRWKEVMLLWVGRDNVLFEQKEGFIKALIEFDDGFNREFYWYRSVFVASVLIAEFKDCSLADAIVAQIVEWGFGYFNVEKQEWRTFLYPIKEGAKKVLKETEREKSITALVELISTSQNEYTRRLAAESLGEIDQDNPVALAALVELIRTSQDESTQREAAYSLGKIGKDNPVALAALVELISTSQSESTRRQAAESLGKIGKDNPVALAALVELISTSQDESTRREAAYSLGKIGKDNPVAISALVVLMGTSQSESIRLRAAYSLEKIGKDNPVGIAGLVELIRTSQDESTRTQAAESLEEIGKNNSVAISALVKLIRTSQDESTRRQAGYSLGKIGKDNPVAISALVELIRTSQDESTQMRAAYSLGQIGKNNPDTIAALAELIRTSQSESTRRQAAYSLVKIDKDNPVAIADLVELMGTSQSESTRRQAAYSLGEIDKDNPVAIVGLVELMGTSQSESTRRQAAYSLVKIGKDNPVAISALVELIRTSQSESTRMQAAYSLVKIDKDNPVAISALVELIRTSQDESIRWQAAYSLGEIGKDNPVAIAGLVELIRTSQDESTRTRAAESLGQIGKDNPVAIAGLVELIRTSQDESTQWKAAESLRKIVTLSQQLLGVVTALKDYLSDETYNNDFNRFNNCYKVLWKCAQNLPYPTFYEAWHHPPTTPHPEVLETTAASATPTTITLNWQTFPQDIARAINNDANLSHHLKPISLDINKFLDPDNPAAKIYSEMLLQGCPKSQDSKPKTLAELQTYWDELRIESDISPLLIFYDSQTGTENATAFSNTFLKALSKFDGFICAVCDAADIFLPTFSPSQPNLIANMVGWMREKVMES